MSSFSHLYVLFSLVIIDVFFSIFVEGTKSSTPNWIDTFRMDDACDMDTCCCLTNEVRLSKTDHHAIRMTGNTTGQCGNLSSTFSITEQMPTGFRTYVQLYGQIYRFQLGQDSSYISSVNANHAYCSSNGLRASYNAANMESMNLDLIMFILLITVSIII
jgi:hypothetical protein